MPVEIKAEDDSELVFTFADNVLAYRFDEKSTHGMPDMSRVDLIATSPDDTWLIEVKDADFNKIPPKHRSARQAADRAKLSTEAFYKETLASKLRDTLVHLALSQKAPANRITYVVLFELAALDKDTALLSAADYMLKKHCYLPGPNKQPWISGFNAILVNMTAWNVALAPHSVRRGP